MSVVFSKKDGIWVCSAGDVLHTFTLVYHAPKYYFVEEGSEDFDPYLPTRIAIEKADSPQQCLLWKMDSAGELDEVLGSDEEGEDIVVEEFSLPADHPILNLVKFKDVFIG